MTAKNFLIVLVTLVATLVYPDVTIWLVPLVISIVTISKFRKIDIAKFIGFLSLKSVLTYFLLLASAKIGFSKQLYTLYSFEIGSAIMAAVPELILTLVIVYGFRHLFGANKLIWPFLIGDTIRWLIIGIELLIPDPFPEPYFYTQLYILIFFLLIFPPLYAIVGFIFAREHALSKNNIN